MLTDWKSWRRRNMGRSCGVKREQRYSRRGTNSIAYKWKESVPKKTTTIKQNLSS